MYEAIVESVKCYAFLTLNVFPPMLIGYWLNKKGHEYENELICDIGACIFVWGCLWVMFWLIMTVCWLHYFLIEKPLTPERFMYFVNIIKNGK